jgi:hypothetical protein
MVVLVKKEKQPVLQIGVFTQNNTQSDQSATLQWKSKKRPPHPHQNAAKEFRNDLATYNQQKGRRRVTANKWTPFLYPNVPSPCRGRMLMTH